ncbi:MAG TPA: hypothetical protein VIM79_26095 [Niastella sp.]
MNRILLFLALIGAGQVVHAQYVYTIKADSVKITNTCDTAELIIENHTQTVPGFLYNRGRGRTEFRRGAMALNDSLYVIGGDTINLYKGRVNVTASNGLNATNNHVKIGGPINDEWTDMWFDYKPDEKGYKELGIYSHDFNNYFKVSESNYGDDVQTALSFSTWNQDFGGGSFGCAPGGFSAESFSAHGGDPKQIVLDSTGFHVTNSPMTIGFPGGGGPYGIGSNDAMLYLAAGKSTPGGAPIKMMPGQLLTTPELNAIEYDGFDLYLTEHSVRYRLGKILQGQLTTNFGGASLTAFNAVTTTLTVANAKPGDVVNVSANSGAVNPASIIITAYVTSANTVTLQAYNASNSAITLASDTYKVRVIK